MVCQACGGWGQLFFYRNLSPSSIHTALPCPLWVPWSAFPSSRASAGVGGEGVVISRHPPPPTPPFCVHSTSSGTGGQKPSAEGPARTALQNARPQQLWVPRASAGGGPGARRDQYRVSLPGHRVAGPQARPHSLLKSAAVFTSLLGFSAPILEERVTG